MRKIGFIVILLICGSCRTVKHIDFLAGTRKGNGSFMIDQGNKWLVITSYSKGKKILTVEYPSFKCIATYSLVSRENTCLFFEQKIITGNNKIMDGKQLKIYLLDSNNTKLVYYDSQLPDITIAEAYVKLEE